MTLGNQLAPSPQRLAGYGAALLAAVLLSTLVMRLPAVVAICAIVALGLLVLVSRRPEAGFLVAIAALYLNLPAIAFQNYGVPQVVAGVAPITLLVPLVASLIARRRPFRIDKVFLLMLVFLGAVLLSMFAVVKEELAIPWLVQYLCEGLALYLVILNVVRTAGALRRLLAVLVFAGALLGALSLYQELTHSYEQTFFGLAQRNLSRETEDEQAWDAYEGGHERDSVRLMHRAMGPIGDPNRYAQLLIVLLPFACWRLIHVRRPISKIMAAGCALLILAGIALSYSRGAFVTIALLVPLALATRFVRWQHLLLAAAALTAAFAIAAPGYMSRMNTLRGLWGLYSSESKTAPDAIQRSRATEMLAALGVFLDHPVIGVGPGQYSPVYSVDYMNRGPVLRRMRENRRAHSLYLELAAETGLVGLAAFLSIPGYLLFRLTRAARRLRERAPASAALANAFLLAFAGYFSTALFLHFSYQRYYWLLVAITGAALQVLVMKAKIPMTSKTDDNPRRMRPTGSIFEGI